MTREQIPTSRHGELVFHCSHMRFSESGIEMGFSPSTSVSPVSIIPLLLHSPLSVSFHFCSILIFSFNTVIIVTTEGRNLRTYKKMFFWISSSNGQYFRIDVYCCTVCSTNEYIMKQTYVPLITIREITHKIVFPLPVL